MKINIDISDDLLAKARKVSIKDEKCFNRKGPTIFRYY
jgi:hypothetical protein